MAPLASAPSLLPAELPSVMLLNGDCPESLKKEERAPELPRENGLDEAEPGEETTGQEVIVIQDTGFSVKILAPGIEPFSLQVRWRRSAGNQSVSPLGRTRLEGHVWPSLVLALYCRAVCPHQGVWGLFLGRCPPRRWYRRSTRYSWTAKTHVTAPASHCTWMATCWTISQSFAVSRGCKRARCYVWWKVCPEVGQPAKGRHTEVGPGGTPPTLAGISVSQMSVWRLGTVLNL